MRVEVTDDGAGFATTASNGSGLAGLRDRVDVLGGTLDVDATPGMGTRLQARLPLREGACDG